MLVTDTRLRDALRAAPDVAAATGSTDPTVDVFSLERFDRRPSPASRRRRERATARAREPIASQRVLSVGGRAEGDLSLVLVLTVTLLGELDLLEAQLEYHLSAGVDHVVVGRLEASSDGVREELDRFARDGRHGRVSRRATIAARALSLRRRCDRARRRVDHRKRRRRVLVAERAVALEGSRADSASLHDGPGARSRLSSASRRDGSFDERMTVRPSLLVSRHAPGAAGVGPATGSPCASDTTIVDAVGTALRAAARVVSDRGLPVSAPQLGTGGGSCNPRTSLGRPSRPHSMRASARARFDGIPTSSSTTSRPGAACRRVACRGPSPARVPPRTTLGPWHDHAHDTDDRRRSQPCGRVRRGRRSGSRRTRSPHSRARGPNLESRATVLAACRPSAVATHAPQRGVGRCCSFGIEPRAQCEPSPATSLASECDWNKARRASVRGAIG